MSTALRVAQFRWRLFSIAQRVTPKLFVDKVDRNTLESRMEAPSVIKNFYVTFATYRDAFRG